MQNGSYSFYLALRATHPGEATARKRTAKNNRRGAMSLSGVARRDPLYRGVCRWGADGRRCCNVRIRSCHDAISDVNVVHCWLWRTKVSLFFLVLSSLSDRARNPLSKNSSLRVIARPNRLY
ncbi:hypothetical protein M441DRAFT_252876 [Trichoderma asperellum CBS 433.97]|uniref:Uncharacterized protein n=1 Tax=Trichoderma asperellum (strain ATCC 204424 / CBS 433.97 / NBRC 101777) TaxID=1042311 RepID=A0A2T3YY84_TRIA4|nr:hypothetical protein M441DRAFT_252876 [Trichoderma asperellum CBS 433.97]PTB37490.1 hypothetical protein M441DRAFT_252876 [Trichoderma asperellum CBS 433.97]